MILDLIYRSSSNGVDPEYAVIGRVARKIWAKAMKINMVLTNALKC
jgi:hypothetical protein